MFEDSQIIAAIVAGTVSLVVSGVTGIYTLLVGRRRFENLRKELIVTASTNSFLNSRERFLNSCRKFEIELAAINEANPKDGTEAIQFAIDFFGNVAREFYRKHRSTLGTDKLDGLLVSINDALESGKLNDTENHAGKREFGMSIVAFCGSLSKRVLEVT